MLLAGRIVLSAVFVAFVTTPLVAQTPTYPQPDASPNTLPTVAPVTTAKPLQQAPYPGNPVFPALAAPTPSKEPLPSVGYDTERLQEKQLPPVKTHPTSHRFETPAPSPAAPEFTTPSAPPAPSNPSPAGNPATRTIVPPQITPSTTPVLAPSLVPEVVPTPTPTVQASLPSVEAYSPQPVLPKPDTLGSAYIPLDSPIYPMALRLYSLGYLDSAFLAMRPWTRRSLLHMLDRTEQAVALSHEEQAREIYVKLRYLIGSESPTTPEGTPLLRGPVYGLESAYTRLMGIGGTTLRDSFHLGTSLQNDYGRPYSTGFNSLAGFSSVNEWGRFSLYVRGEYQHAPARTDYSFTTAYDLSYFDEIPYTGPTSNPTIPFGTTPAQNPFRLQEAALSFHLLNHEVSFGKTDDWTGPGLGGAFGFSNNAEDIYSFRINRAEPLNIPLLHYLLGPLRYDVLVGSLKGHSDPNDPWIHEEQFEFQPTKDVQLGFSRSVIWGGKGHTPITLHTFLKSFFDVNDTNVNEKYSRDDPGARFSFFNFSWRLPYARHSLTLYLDTMTHDDVSPVSAPRRSSLRPGLYLAKFPRLPKLDLRVEAADTDPDAGNSQFNRVNYWEVVQVQGYTNKSFIMGDWIGREAKGGQAWLTWHLSGDEWAQFAWLNKKEPIDDTQLPNDPTPGGTTQNQFRLEVRKRLRPNLELDAWIQHERWKAAVYKPGQQSDTIGAFQLTFYPRLRTPTGLAGH